MTLTGDRRHETARGWNRFGRQFTAAGSGKPGAVGVPWFRTLPDGWARSHLLHTEKKIRQACGLMGGCWFALCYKQPDGLHSLVDSLHATTGWDVTLDETLEAGHRSIVLQSIFGTRRGWTTKHDWKDVGPRFLEPIPDGKFKGFTIAQWLPDLVHKYTGFAGGTRRRGVLSGIH